MTYDVNVYLPELGDHLARAARDRLARIGIDCQLHPDFVLEPLISGFLPLRLKVRDSGFKQYDEFPDWIATGFQIHTSDMEWQDVVDSDTPPGLVEKLKRCRCEILICCRGHDTCEFRAALLFAGALAEASGGVALDCYEGDYLEPTLAMSKLLERVERFERQEVQWILNPFEGWEAFDLRLDPAGDYDEEGEQEFNAHLLAARACMQRQEWDDAVLVFKEMAIIWPEHDAVREGLITSLEKAGRADELRAYLDEKAL